MCANHLAVYEMPNFSHYQLSDLSCDEPLHKDTSQVFPVIISILSFIFFLYLLGFFHKRTTKSKPINVILYASLVCVIGIAVGYVVKAEAIVPQNVCKTYETWVH